METMISPEEEAAAKELEAEVGDLAKKVEHRGRMSVSRKTKMKAAFLGMIAMLAVGGPAERAYAQSPSYGEQVIGDILRQAVYTGANLVNQEEYSKTTQRQESQQSQESIRARDQELQNQREIERNEKEIMELRARQEERAEKRQNLQRECDILIQKNKSDLSDVQLDMLRGCRDYYFGSASARNRP